MVHLVLHFHPMHTTALPYVKFTVRLEELKDSIWRSARYGRINVKLKGILKGTIVTLLRGGDMHVCDAT